MAIIRLGGSALVSAFQIQWRISDGHEIQTNRLPRQLGEGGSIVQNRLMAWLLSANHRVLVVGHLLRYSNTETRSLLSLITEELWDLVCMDLLWLNFQDTRIVPGLLCIQLSPLIHIGIRDYTLEGFADVTHGL